MVKGYRILKERCRAGKSILYDAVADDNNSLVFILVADEEYPSLDDLVSLKNDFVITHKLPLKGVLKSQSLEKTATGIAVVKTYFEGIPLLSLIESNQLSIPETLKIAVEMADMLADIHHNRIIHKDINTSNFLINPETLEVRLFNFGIATQLSTELPTSANSDKIRGMLHYISPEQTGRMNRSIDYRTDFYSLGVVLYRMLCGKYPFDYANRMELVHAHIAKKPDEPSRINPNLPKPVSDIVVKLLSKNAEDRYQNANALKYDLQECLRLYQVSGDFKSFVFGKKDFSTMFRISEKLYGREKEIRKLVEAFEKARLSALEMILVAGYSGLGKTRLIHEIHKPIARENGYFTSGKFDQYNRNTPYSAIGIAIGGLIRQFLAEPQESFNAWKQNISKSVEENGDVLVDVIPELELLIGKQPKAIKLGLSETQHRFFQVFTQFIKSLSTPQRPLVVFLDDLQWVDSGSLELLKHLMNQPDISHTLFIGSYRDNEVTPSHPLLSLIGNLKQTRQNISTITLTELDASQVNLLIADSLHQEPTKTNVLTRLVMNKTRGNPFFINQFVLKLVEDKLIYFNVNDGTWHWDEAGIVNTNIADNVVELLVKKIQTLPEQTQNTIRLASCIGNRFDLYTLTIISEKETLVVGEELWAAVKEDLLNPVDQRSQHFNDSLWEEIGVVGSSANVSEFYFQHDRIQQAAYTLIPEDEKKKTHLRIGRLLLKKLSPGEVNEDVFNVINHFNLAHDLITDPGERLQIARLSEVAGNRAKNSNAYQPAVNYLRTGLSLISPNDDQELFNNMLLACSESEYLSGNYNESEKLFDEAVSNAKSGLEKAEVLARKMQLYENTSRQMDAIKVAIEGLKLLGTVLPEKPGTAAVMLELAKAKYYLWGKKVEDLENNVDMKSPERILTMKILMNLYGPGFLYNQQLLLVAILRMVVLSVRYGNAPESALAYTFYGFVVSAQLKDYEQGDAFGQLGMRLNEKFNDTVLRSKVYVIYAGCIAHWRHAFNTFTDTLIKAYYVGIETNDIIYACYATNHLTKVLYAEGDPLPELYEKCRAYLAFSRQAQNLTASYHLLTQIRMVILLMDVEPDEAVFHELTDDNDAEKRLIGYAENEGIQLPIIWHYYFHTEWHFRMENYELALEYHGKTKKIIAGLMGFAEIELLKFFHSMILLAGARNPQGQSKGGLLRTIRSNQKALKKAATHAPGNFLARYLLVEAETAAFENNFEKAMRTYRKAKEAAQNGGVLQDLALVCEKTAEFYRQYDMAELSHSLYREAIFHYMQWGAKAKVQQLERKLHKLGIHVLETYSGYQKHTFDTTVKDTSASSLDLQSIFQASTTISGEVVFEKLLEKLMKILLENAGAESGSLLLVKDDNLYIAAKSEMQDSPVTEIKDVLMEDVEDIAKTVVRFVYHANETLILNEAVKDPRFAKDPYLIEYNPKSILCQPIIQHGKCIAIIYLENELAADAFTPARREVLKLLSGQIAVSMQNAMLYKHQHEVSNAYQRFVPQDFISALGHKNILQVKLGDNINQEMTVMCCDIRSYTSIAEGMTVADNFEFINSYLMLVGPIIKKHNGFINHYLGDGFIALFKDSAEDALLAATEMTLQLNDYNKAQRKDKIPIVLGIGIHTGPVMMGIIGDQDRHDANVLSDAVNIASRLESLTKYFGANVLLSETTSRSLLRSENFTFRHLGRIKVKGKGNALGIDELLDSDSQGIREAKLKNLERYNAGLASYFKKEFGEAASILKTVLEANPSDRVAYHYYEKAIQWSTVGEPADWDGTEHMTEK